MNETHVPELLLPAGSPGKLRMALAYGADAVYVGARGLSMRPDEASFNEDMLKAAIEEVHRQGKRLYVALNTMMFGEDLDEVRRWLTGTHELAFDAFIVSDAGAFSMVRRERPDVAVHISTQAGIANPEAAAFWRDAGASRVILARECTLEQAAEVAGLSGLEVEVFVHGAMCMAVSGRCLLSAHLCGKSGSQGECKHSCRWDWQLVEAKRPGETVPVFETGRETIFLGSTDLCLVEHIPALVRAGLTSLKVEGRMKGEAYIAGVTRVYRAALDRYAADPAGYEFDPAWLEELEALSHRPYSAGFAFGYPVQDPGALQADGTPFSTAEVLGFVTGDSDGMVAVSAKNPFAAGEEIEWIGPDMTGGKVRVSEILDEAGEPRERTHCGTQAYVRFAGDARLGEHAVLRRRITRG